VSGRGAVVARAPGKLVALGEYAVLDGAPALVLTVDRYAAASVAPDPGPECHLTTLMPGAAEHRFPPDRPSGVPLVDLVTAASPAFRASPPWRGTLDSTAFFAAGSKLGLGSSAAALCAWAGAFRTFAAQAPIDAVAPTARELIELHRAFQGGRGSGLDVAASHTGGVIVYQLAGSGEPQIGSVRLPNSVGFAGIFAGRSASTPGLVARYRGWGREHPDQAAAMHASLTRVAEAGCAAARGHDGVALVESIAEYGRALQNLGSAIGADIVTAEHRRIGEHARRHGVAYKVSGAGGGDLGLACALDAAALAAFSRAVGADGFEVIEVRPADRGLTVDSGIDAGSSAK
jgi:phosphomevalonate kinase